MQYLIDLGSDFRAEDDKALCEAAQYGHAEIVELFLTLGCNPNAKNNKALQSAVLKGHTKITQLLLAAGSRPDIETDFCSLIAERGYLEIVKLLMAANSDFHIKDALIGAVLGGHIEIVNYLLAAGCDPRAKNNKALYLAAYTKRVEIVSVLMEAGAIFNPEWHKISEDIRQHCINFFPLGPKSAAKLD